MHKRQLLAPGASALLSASGWEGRAGAVADACTAERGQSLCCCTQPLPWSPSLQQQPGDCCTLHLTLKKNAPHFKSHSLETFLSYPPYVTKTPSFFPIVTVMTVGFELLFWFVRLSSATSAPSQSPSVCVTPLGLLQQN